MRLRVGCKEGPWIIVFFRLLLHVVVLPPSLVTRNSFASGPSREVTSELEHHHSAKKKKKNKRNKKDSIHPATRFLRTRTSSATFTIFRLPTCFLIYDLRFHAAFRLLLFSVFFLHPVGQNRDRGTCSQSSSYFDSRFDVGGIPVTQQPCVA